MWRPRLRKLWTQIFVAQLVILIVTVGVGFALYGRAARAQLDGQFEQRAVAIAQTVAGLPEVQHCIERGPCPESIQSIAERIRKETHSSFVVVIDMNRVRHSHPKPGLIGKQVEEPILTRDGRTHVRIDNGAEHASANGLAPMWGADGRMIGEVSVGIQETSVNKELRRELPGYAGWVGLALGIGAFASWLLARRLKRRTFGLELDEIARLLQEREAMLHGIREGVIAFDRAGKVAVVNDEARRLLGISPAALGRKLEDLLPAGRLRDVLAGDVTGQDELVLTDDYCLTVNRMPVVLAAQPHGAVVTLRDRTETSGLLRELDGVRSLTDALRSQQHEFSNRLHAVTGLLELGLVDEALSYLTDLSAASAEFAETLRAHIASPLVVGLLLGKAAEASERGVLLEITDDTVLSEAPQKVQAIATIVGNLVDNALEALPAASTGRVTVSIVESETSIVIRVRDNGPGIPAGAVQEIFEDGFTTKADRGPLRRGLGLALVHRLVQRLNGTMTVSSGPGAEFTVELPLELPAEPAFGGALDVEIGR